MDTAGRRRNENDGGTYISTISVNNNVWDRAGKRGPHADVIRTLHGQSGVSNAIHTDPPPKGGCRWVNPGTGAEVAKLL